MRTNRTTAVLFAATLGILGAGAYGAEPTYDELKQRVDQLQARLEQLEARPVSAKDVDATVERVLKDANRRSQLLAAEGGITAGYDRGFFIKSEDGAFLLKPGVQMQFRNNTTFRTEDEDGDEDIQNGFELRRLRLRIEGNAFSPDLTYGFVWDSNRSGGSTSLLDAWGAYKFAPTWTVKFGQFRESWVHEGDVSDTSQLAVERSLIDSLLAGSVVDRVQGASLIYGAQDKPLRTEFTFHDGANSKNTDFRDTPEGNFGVGARAEFKFSGAWADYRDFTAKNTKQALIIVGAGGDWTQAGDTDVYRTTADAQYEGTNGLGVYAAIHGNFSQLADDDRFDWGALAQVGYLFNPSWEVFGRADVVALDDEFVTDEDTLPELTAGVNYYLGTDGKFLHRAKLTLDLTYLPNGVPSNQTGIGALASEDDEFILRGQFTLVL